jgi:hypothetical protein
LRLKVAQASHFDVFVEIVACVGCHVRHSMRACGLLSLFGHNLASVSLRLEVSFFTLTVLVSHLATASRLHALVLQLCNVASAW